MWLSDKESTHQCKRSGFHPWVGRIPWRRKRQPNIYSFSASFPTYHYRVLSRVLCASQSVVTDYLFYQYIYSSIYMLILTSVIVSLKTGSGQTLEDTENMKTDTEQPKNVDNWTHRDAESVQAPGKNPDRKRAHHVRAIGVSVG